MGVNAQRKIFTFGSDPFGRVDSDIRTLTLYMHWVRTLTLPLPLTAADVD